MTPEPRVIVALDFSDAQSALAFVRGLSPRLCRLKVGKELFTIAGPDVVRFLVKSGFDVFLDLKFHDIPNTVAKACQAAAALGVWMINVHALGGRDMMQAARAALGSAQRRPKLIAVTVLTSLTARELDEIGIQGDPAAAALRLAGLAHASGLDGVVCSAHEAAALRARFGNAFLRVTPGIRTMGSASDDQMRVMTPERAIENGASYLVIGRPVTEASDPVGEIERINRSIDGTREAR